jgi:hypothetical protein
LALVLSSAGEGVAAETETAIARGKRAETVRSREVECFLVDEMSLKSADVFITPDYQWKGNSVKTGGGRSEVFCVQVAGGCSPRSANQ